MDQRDPVCGMMFDPEDAVDEVEFGGETYYFCSEECLTKFELNPQSYVQELSI